ncbi:MAG: hypothetical protein QM346_12760, partial [Chloroflexota bacterium]|nr:hypothetical protein [Chloroflexota bacterium]
DLFIEHHVGPVPELKVGTDSELLATLDEKSLSTWNDWTVAVPARIEKAREAAVKLLEPKAVRVQPKSVTLRTPADVDAYLDDLRAEIMQHVDNQTPVMI